MVGGAAGGRERPGTTEPAPRRASPRPGRAVVVGRWWGFSRAYARVRAGDSNSPQEYPNWNLLGLRSLESEATDSGKGRIREIINLKENNINTRHLKFY